MLIVEVGIKLDKDFEYYDNLLKNNGLINDFKVITHDIYYTDKSLEGLSENEMKNACTSTPIVCIALSRESHKQKTYPEIRPDKNAPSTVSEPTA